MSSVFNTEAESTTAPTQEQQQQHPEIIVSATTVDEITHSHAMSFPTLQGSFPKSQENFLHNFVYDLDTPAPKQPSYFDDSTSSITAFPGQYLSQSTSTILETPNSSQPLQPNQPTLTHSASRIFSPPIPLSAVSKQHNCCNNLFFRFCCNIRNALLSL